MNCILLARISLSFLCAIQGMATLAIDLNRTHAANPAWTGHARFHVVWQSASVALLSVLELALIWMRGPYREGGFYLASLLARRGESLQGPYRIPTAYRRSGGRCSA